MASTDSRRGFLGRTGAALGALTTIGVAGAGVAIADAPKDGNASKKLKDLAPQNAAADQPKLTDAAANVTKADIVSVLTSGKETPAALALTVKDLKSIQAVFLAKTASPTADAAADACCCCPPCCCCCAVSVQLPIRAA
jgi:hypothetical protein